uniref:Uncharacterized protein n=1 Tax=Arion vulgaris TaxID=1028688 RepID=A0A0B7B499_9EUPU
MFYVAAQIGKCRSFSVCLFALHYILLSQCLACLSTWQHFVFNGVAGKLLFV